MKVRCSKCGTVYFNRCTAIPTNAVFTKKYCTSTCPRCGNTDTYIGTPHIEKPTTAG